MNQRTLCNVPECDRQASSRGYCSIHYNRIYKTGTPYRHCKKCNSVLPEDHGRKTLCADCLEDHRCSVDGCERPYHANGYCNTHGYHAERYGDPLAKGPGRHSGRKRMELPSYAGLHKRIFYDRGRASQFKCVDCGAQAEEWSYDGGCPNEIWEEVRGVMLAYTIDQDRYSPRCKQCHRRRDLSVVRNRDELGRWAG